MTLSQRVGALLGTWNAPPDFPAKAALGIGLFLALLAATNRGHTLFPDVPLSPGQRRRFLLVCSLVAALLSIAYVSSYLLGGPRIIDATTYFLQGRALSHGEFAWTPLEPSASFRGRFLVHRETASGATLGGIFPPGYPLLLAFGFLLGAPMIVGPLLAGALVIATYHLAKTLAEESSPLLAEPVARAAALLSVSCAALRYHTADTMSHGASALGVTTGLYFAIATRKTGRAAPAIFAGLATGYVLATRPVSALAIGAVALWLVGRPLRPRLLALLALGMLPGLVLLLASQHAVTGAWLGSTQRMYYALSDGPSDCFRWGFGKNTGCLFEHGEFVQARLEHGYGITSAIGTTARRIWPHLLDVANLEPLAFFVLAPVLLRRRATIPFLRTATCLVALHVAVYVPFYFDGNYPGGGARFFADVLPVEHALVMVGVACIVRDSAAAFRRAALAMLSLATAGFAVHGSYEHKKLRERDSGPMFDPDVIARAKLTSALLFVETDHGFNLGHDPRARRGRGLIVARLRKDDRDRMLYDALGAPATYLYRTAPPAKESPLIPWVPPGPDGSFRFEAEAEWPALAQEGGFAAPAWTSACAGNGRALVVTPDAKDTPARVTITVPVPSAGQWSVEVRLVQGASVPFAQNASPDRTEGHLTMAGERWSWGPKTGKDGQECVRLPPKVVELTPPRALVTIEASFGPVAVDSLLLRKIP